MSNKINNAPNPLAAYFRQIKLTTPLPTKGIYYHDGFLPLTPNNEIEVTALTTMDEINFKNPDLLVSGQATINAIKSCTKIQRPELLLLPDVEAIMIAIRIASFGDMMNMKITCPECQKKKNKAMESIKDIKEDDITEELKNDINIDPDFDVDINLRNLLDTMKFLEGKRTYETKDGPIVTLTPYKYNMFTKTHLIEFEFNKMMKYLTDTNLDELDKLQKTKQPFDKINQIHQELICSSVESIQIKNETITNRDHINEYIKNIESSYINDMKEILDELNMTGISNKIKVTCPKCGHECEVSGITNDYSRFFA